MLQALDDPDADRIEHGKHHNGYGRCCLGRGDRGRYVCRDDDIDLTIDEIGNHGVVVGIQHSLAVFDPQVPALDITKLRQTPPEDVKPFRIGVLGGDITQKRHWLGSAVCHMQQRQQCQAGHSKASPE